MDQLREGIGLRAYGQKDPLIEYKQEGFRAFTEMLGGIDKEILGIVFKYQIQMEQAPSGLQQSPREQPVEMATVHEEATGMGFERIEQPEAQQVQESRGHQIQQPPTVGKRQPIRVEKKVGRNDPCPCGSGKKYKKCHGKVAS